MNSHRLDLLLLERKLVSTRTKAQELIREGKVLVNGKVARKTGEKFTENVILTLLEAEHPYVSRGGLKLAAALESFSVAVAGKRALDVGQSTGGFTHCLLREGAAEVVGVEVGHGQLAPSLKEDARVKCIENQDIRELSPDAVKPSFSLCVADLSFISLRLVLPCLPPFLKLGADVVALVKPQFEVGPRKVGSGGIVRDAKMRAEALSAVEKICRELGFTVAGSIPSPVEGSDGNQEFLLHLRWHSSAADF
jgi:23S rRNA (cytidine1920-2'-O)/16S rRNA (cytidine1409-2'-O)-methyltransferase